MWLLTYVLMWASLTTYCKWGGQEDVYVRNWIVCGACYGMAALPFVCATERWRRFYARTVLLMGTIWLFSDLGVVKGVVWQEIGRGMMFVGTLAMLVRREKK